MDMIEKKFYLRSASPLQDIGMRAQIVSFLMARGVERGNALNDSDDRNKVIVAIRFENESAIREMRDELVKHLNMLHMDKLCFGSFPSDIAASELFELNNPHPVSVMDFNVVANSLMLGQTSKGAGAMIYMAKTTGGMSSDMKIMSGDMKTMSTDMKSMSGEMKSMSTEMKSIANAIENLPARLAVELNKLWKKP